MNEIFKAFSQVILTSSLNGKLWWTLNLCSTNQYLWSQHICVRECWILFFCLFFDIENSKNFLSRFMAVEMSGLKDILEIGAYHVFLQLRPEVLDQLKLNFGFHFRPKKSIENLFLGQWNLEFCRFHNFGHFATCILRCSTFLDSSWFWRAFSFSNFSRKRTIILIDYYEKTIRQEMSIDPSLRPNVIFVITYQVFCHENLFVSNVGSKNLTRRILKVKSIRKVSISFSPLFWDDPEKFPKWC